MSTVEKLLIEAKALLKGHFKLTSGRHSDTYIEKIKLIHDPEKVSQLCELLAEKLKDVEADVIVGPAMGGIVLAYEVAKKLGKKFVFTQRKDGEMTIRSGFPISAGDKAVIIEDIVTTGGSVFEVLEALKKREINVTAIGLIVDRSGGKTDFGHPTYALHTVDIQSYPPEECPQCKAGDPITTPGSSDKK